MKLMMSMTDKSEIEKKRITCLNVFFNYIFCIFSKLLTIQSKAMLTI